MNLRNHYDVTVIVFGKGADLKILKGIKIITLPFKHAKERRFLMDIETIKVNVYFLRAILRSRCHVIISKCATSFGTVFLAAKLTSKKCLLIGANDGDFDGSVIERDIPSFARSLFHLSIFLADEVVAQNENQAALIQRNYGRTSVMIKSYLNSARQFDNKEDIEKVPFHDGFILWVGRLVQDKRPELIRILAEKLPNIEFVIIGPDYSSNDRESRKLIEFSKSHKNLHYVGFVAYNLISKYFRQCRILINTSESEGFPNTFLQAWSVGKPVVSLDIDPGGVIKRMELGRVSLSVDQMICDINNLIDNEVEYSKISCNALKYVNDCHDDSSLTNQYEKVLSYLGVKRND